MGSFLSPSKSGYYWFILGYLQDKNIYVRDARLIPYTPGAAQTYVDFYPQYYKGTTNPGVLTFQINGQPAARAALTSPNGLVYADIPVPKGRFTLTTWNGTTLLKTEEFISKNFSMLLGVQAQSYSERLTGLQEIMADQNWETLRSDRLYSVIGANFSFPPPPGWTPQQYRSTLIGGGANGPGMVQAALWGTTQAAISAAIQSVTGVAPTITPAENGIRWTVRNRANTQPSNPGATGFYVTSRADMGRQFTPPHYRAMCSSENWWSNTAFVKVNGSRRQVQDEVLYKQTDSFIQSGFAGPYPNLAGMTLVFSVAVVGNPSLTKTYSTVFPAGTINASQMATAIAAQNPTLQANCIYSSNGFLRIGVAPQFNQVFQITILSGSILPVVGWTAGQSVQVACDQLANQWVGVGSMGLPVVLVDANGHTWTVGVDFELDEPSGQLAWMPSSATEPNLPPMGTLLYASYFYQMRREILKLVGDIQNTNDNLVFSWN